MQIGKRIKQARKSKRMTQEQLAEATNCTTTHICNIENGKIGISLELLFRVSVVLEQSLDYFVMDNINANPKVRIDETIAPKLTQCDSQMLGMVGHFIDDLITYREAFEKSIRTEMNQRDNAQIFLLKRKDAGLPGTDLTTLLFSI